MADFYLIKYPVTSKSGREYRVDIRSDIIYGGSVMCGIFEVRKGLFGRYKFVQLNSTSMMRNVYDEAKWNYNYVAIAREEIEEYEEGIREQIEREESRKKGASDFDKWDGGLAE